MDKAGEIRCRCAGKLCKTCICCESISGQLLPSQEKSRSKERPFRLTRQMCLSGFAQDGYCDVNGHIGVQGYADCMVTYGLDVVGKSNL